MGEQAALRGGAGRHTNKPKQRHRRGRRHACGACPDTQTLCQYLHAQSTPVTPQGRDRVRRPIKERTRHVFV